MFCNAEIQEKFQSLTKKKHAVRFLGKIAGGGTICLNNRIISDKQRWCRHGLEEDKKK